jgi:hypothetical protein
MHHVCRDFLIANSLNAADVDGDGFEDYSVIDERRGLMTVIFHLGKGGNVRREWPRLILGETSNPEYACLGDLDGDGALDLVVGGRRHSITKQYAGIRWLRAPADRKARRALSKWTATATSICSATSRSITIAGRIERTFRGSAWSGLKIH